MPPVESTSVQPPSRLVVWRARLVGRLFFPAVALLILASVAAFYFLFWQLWMSVQNGTSDLSTAAVQLKKENAEAEVKMLARHDAELTNLPTSDLERMAIALPSNPDVPNLLVQLEALSLESGMINASFSADLGQGATEVPTGDGKKAQQVAGHFHFLAPNYDQYKNVIAAVQKNLRLIDIASTSYDPKSHVADITFVTYYLR